MIGQEAVEEVYIVLAEGGQIEEAIDIGGLQGKLGETSLLLYFVTLHAGRSEAIGTQVLANGDWEVGIVVGRGIGDTRGGHGVLARRMAVGQNAAHVAGMLGDSTLSGSFGSHIVYRDTDRMAGSPRESV